MHIWRAIGFFLEDTLHKLEGKRGPIPGVEQFQGAQDGHGPAADPGQVQGDWEAVAAFSGQRDLQPLPVPLLHHQSDHAGSTGVESLQAACGRGESDHRAQIRFWFRQFQPEQFLRYRRALNMVMLAYNLMSLFRQSILGVRVQQKLSTLRYRLFAVGGYMVKEGNQHILKLFLAMKRKAWFLGLWDKTSKFSLPIKLETAPPYCVIWNNRSEPSHFQETFYADLDAIGVFAYDSRLGSVKAPGKSKYDSAIGEISVRQASVVAGMHDPYDRLYFHQTAFLDPIRE